MEYTWCSWSPLWYTYTESGCFCKYKYTVSFFTDQGLRYEPVVYYVKLGRHIRQLYHEDGGRVLFQSYGNPLQENTVSKPRSLYSEKYVSASSEFLWAEAAATLE